MAQEVYDGAIGIDLGMSYDHSQNASMDINIHLQSRTKG